MADTCAARHPEQADIVCTLSGQHGDHWHRPTDTMWPNTELLREVSRPIGKRKGEAKKMAVRAVNSHIHDNDRRVGPPRMTRPARHEPIAMEPPTPQSTLDYVQDWILAHLEAGQSVTCPACSQYAKVYKRRMLTVSALALIYAYREYGMEPFHMPTLVQRFVPGRAHQGGAATLGSYWGLIAEAAPPREDGGRAGWWRLTEAGRLYVNGGMIPTYAVTFDATVLRREGPQIDIHAALGQDFDLRQLLAESSTP